MTGEKKNTILRVVLTGFMGAGKSTLGPILAGHLGWTFCDADEHLVQEQRASIEAIFEQAGEARFRKLEEDVVSGLLSRERIVIALGGGALESEVTRVRVFGTSGTHLIFLKAAIEVAIARCSVQGDGTVRPVLVNLDRARLAERYQQRLEHYSKAHQTVCTDTGSPTELACLLAKRLFLLGLPQGA